MLLSLGSATLAIVLVVLLPGPDTLVVLRNLLRGGRSLGVRTAVGNLCGLTIWVCLAAFGLTAVLRASEVGYNVLRVVGAGYLVWLGVSLWRSRGATPPAEGVESSPRRGLLGSGFVAGILTNLLNPKVGVFFVAFLPQFVPPGWSVGASTAVLGAEFIVLTAAYWALLIGLAPLVTGWLTTPRIRRRMDRLTGVVLVGFGLHLAAEG
ncbi:MAG: LysE family translocator [Sporichthyaceae bacterium]